MMMIRAARRGATALMLGAIAGPGLAQAQDAVGKALTIESINADYQRDLEKIERQRLAKVGQLAASQPKAQAEATYHDYFQLAIAKGLYADAEPVAERVLKEGGTSARLHTLASLINIVAEADRGAFDESLRDLSGAVSEKARLARKDQDLGLPAASRAAIVDAYYQRLIRGDRYDIARQAMKMVAENAEVPAVRDLAARRHRELELIGQPAPAIAGVDLDGKPFRLDQAKGDVVLVVFWATWCLPVAQQLPWIEETERLYRDKGFRIVGINVDPAQDPNADPMAFVPAIRRYLLDYNISWPILINGRGDADFTRAYSVAEIPANVLIGRDGKVIHLDLVGQKLEKAVGEAVAGKP